MIFHRLFADHTSPSSVASRLRRRRFEIFSRIAAKIPAPVKVLDVGGTPGYWSAISPPAMGRLRVTLLNTTPLAAPPQFTSLVGDARDMSFLEDKTFDVVFSNSVIEHVGGFEDQLRMAREVQRVGRFIYIQTPNRGFPIEPHFEFPFFQHLPLAWRVHLVRRFDLGWYKRIPDPTAARQAVESIRLLSRHEVQLLFPDAAIFTERFLGLAKSFVAFTEA